MKISVEEVGEKSMAVIEEQLKLFQASEIKKQSNPFKKEDGWLSAKDWADVLELSGSRAKEVLLQKCKDGFMERVSTLCGRSRMFFYRMLDKSSWPSQD